MWTLVRDAKWWEEEWWWEGRREGATNTSVEPECNDFCRCDSPKQFGDELISLSAALYATLFHVFSRSFELARFYVCVCGCAGV